MLIPRELENNARNYGLVNIFPISGGNTDVRNRVRANPNANQATATLKPSTVSNIPTSKKPTPFMAFLNPEQTDDLAKQPFVCLINISTTGADHSINSGIGLPSVEILGATTDRLGRH